MLLHLHRHTYLPDLHTFVCSYAQIYLPSRPAYLHMVLHTHRHTYLTFKTVSLRSLSFYFNLKPSILKYEHLLHLNLTHSLYFCIFLYNPPIQLSLTFHFCSLLIRHVTGGSWYLRLDVKMSTNGMKPVCKPVNLFYIQFRVEQSSLLK